MFKKKAKLKKNIPNKYFFFLLLLPPPEKFKSAHLQLATDERRNSSYSFDFQERNSKN